MSKNRIIVRENEHAKVIAAYLASKTDPEMFDFDGRVVGYLEQFRVAFRANLNKGRTNFIEAKEQSYNQVFQVIDQDESKEEFDSLFGE